MKRFSVAAVLVCAAVVVLPAVAAKPQTFSLLEVNTSFVGSGGFDAFGNTPPKVGQGFVVASDYYKWNGTKRGARAGSLNVVCTFVDMGKTICTAAASLTGGRITAAGLIPDSVKFQLPIVGGTGSYTGAKGYVEVTNNLGGPDTNKSNDKFVITG